MLTARGPGGRDRRRDARQRPAVGLHRLRRRFSATFDATGLSVADSPYTITYAYTSDGTFASASTTSGDAGDSAARTILTVNSLGDAGIGSGDSGDLRYCINQANADDEANQIVFDPAVFSTPQTITLSNGQLELEKSAGTQTITGPAAGVTISGGGYSRVFQVDLGATASISGLTISGGSGSYGNGGGLLNSGEVTLFDCTFSGNSAAYGNGGGLANSGQANLTDCTISGNSAGDFGGGVWNANYGVSNLTLTDCTLSGNSAQGGGGVSISNNGTATLFDCTLSGNSATEYGGGGLANSAR